MNTHTKRKTNKNRKVSCTHPPNKKQRVGESVKQTTTKTILQYNTMHQTFDREAKKKKNRAPQN